ncbi:hypothetical protein GCM10023194_04970 [Planotetraspora phitsanulokensis]|uniref:DUF5666 domain-containing protein n=1 Tax=Planotetraspora phitsanulokensis TaxID=575192 RepID=A0A8J3U650_9ACTN|nr:hypothetical protein [Planotetraspora phitsanulokensis]GII38747.1 hypothetical protein Pph01_37500 [Planotetraspora phitsanulokensis]
MPEPGIRPPEFPGRRPTRRKTPHKLILGVGTALVVATGVGLAAAGNLSSQAQPTPSPTGMETGGPVGPPQASPGTPTPGPSPQQMQGPFNAIHGQLVVPKQGGGYQTVTTQTGVVTSIQQNSVAVKSEDGFARTYTIDANTRVCAGREGLSGVKSGHKVWVISTAQGNSSTAILLADLTQPPWPPWAGGAVTSPQPTTPTPLPSGYESGVPSESPAPGESVPVEPTEVPTE